jgi:hypothetical protein
MGSKLISNSQLEKQLLSRLLETWRIFVNRLPAQFDPQVSIEQLDEFGRSNRDDFKNYGNDLINQTEFRQTFAFEEGMNSPGILWDRLTILNCKFFFTAPESIHHKPELHQNLGNVLSELQSVLSALSKSLPAKHILLAKEATSRQSSKSPLEDSLWDLQQSNIAMWINQDLLYTVSADDVDPERLRNYIRFFSIANRIRNTSIENIEIFYSEVMQRR